MQLQHPLIAKASLFFLTLPVQEFQFVDSSTGAKATGLADGVNSTETQHHSKMMILILITRRRL